MLVILTSNPLGNSKKPSNANANLAIYLIKPSVRGRKINLVPSLPQSSRKGLGKLSP